MLPEHFEYIKSHIEGYDLAEVRERYRKREFKNADRCKDLDMRYRWDLFNIVPNTGFLYNYLNDDHIDTALRILVKPL